jgi:ribosomal protein S3
MLIRDVSGGHGLGMKVNVVGRLKQAKSSRTLWTAATRVLEEPRVTLSANRLTRAMSVNFR